MPYHSAVALAQTTSSSYVEIRVAVGLAVGSVSAWRGYVRARDVEQETGRQPWGMSAAVWAIFCFCSVLIGRLCLRAATDRARREVYQQRAPATSTASAWGAQAMQPVQPAPVANPYALPSPGLSANPYAPPTVGAGDRTWSNAPGMVLPANATRKFRWWVPLIAILGGVALIGVTGSWASARTAGQTSVSNGVVHRPATQWPIEQVPPGHDVAAAPTHGDAVVTPRAAKRIVQTYWPQHESALVRQDLTTLATMSSGAARRWEQAAVSCGCRVVSAPRPLLGSSVFVPRQRDYPASFLAEAETSYLGTLWIEVLVFTKPAEHAAWTVSMDSGYMPSASGVAGITAASRDEHGFDRTVTPAQHRRALSAASRLAMLWQHAKNTGLVPSGSGIDLSGPTLDRVVQLAAHPQDQVQSSGLLGHFEFYTSRHDPVFEATDATGNALSCQPVRETVVYSGLAGREVYQDQDQHNWGPMVPPGGYSRIVRHDTWQTCFVIPPDPRAPIVALNQDASGAISRGVR